MRFTSAALVLSLAVQCLSGLTDALMLLPDTCWYMEYMETRFYFLFYYTLSGILLLLLLEYPQKKPTEPI